MPTYAYRCADCGHRFETVQSFTDEALTVCPVCNGVLRKVFNAVGVVFKGSGFYRTDSRAAALAGKGSDTASKGEAKSSGDSGSGGNGTSAAKTGSSDSNGSSSGSSSANGSASKSSDSSSSSSSKTPTG